MIYNTYFTALFGVPSVKSNAAVARVVRRTTTTVYNKS